MDIYRVTIYRVGGLARWRGFTYLADALDWVLHQKRDGTIHLPYLSCLIQEQCETCHLWYDLNSDHHASCLGFADESEPVACEDEGIIVACKGLPIAATWRDRDGYEWTRILCPAHADHFDWEQTHAENI